MRKRRQSLVFPREVLLVEIERHCAEPGCNARTRVGLTKGEARLYEGFECERCERWNADGLTERDIPEWWEDLTVTGLATLRGEAPAGGGGDAARMDEAGEGSEVVARLSEAWQHRTQHDWRGTDDAPRDGGDEPL